MAAIIKQTIEISCSEPDCNNTFRWNPNFTSIRPKRCKVCENRIKLEKQQKYAKRYQEKRQVKIAEQRKQEAGTGGRGAETINNNYPKIKRQKKQIRVKPTIHNVQITNSQPKVRKQGRKWFDLPTNQLIVYVQQKIVNPYIRKRDKAVHANHCISCTTGKVEEAGHFYSVGSTPEMRLMPENIHGQCHHCNALLGSNQKGYNRGLIVRHGQKYIHNLHKLHARSQKANTKLLRHEIIDIANTYKFLSKERIWVFTSEDFEQYLTQSEQASA